MAEPIRVSPSDLKALAAANRKLEYENAKTERAAMKLEAAQRKAAQDNLAHVNAAVGAAGRIQQEITRLLSAFRDLAPAFGLDPTSAEGSQVVSGLEGLQGAAGGAARFGATGVMAGGVFGPEGAAVGGVVGVVVGGVAGAVVGSKQEGIRREQATDLAMIRNELFSMDERMRAMEEGRKATLKELRDQQRLEAVRNRLREGR